MTFGKNIPQLYNFLLPGTVRHRSVPAEFPCQALQNPREKLCPRGVRADDEAASGSGQYRVSQKNYYRSIFDMWLHVRSRSIIDYRSNNDIGALFRKLISIYRARILLSGWLLSSGYPANEKNVCSDERGFISLSISRKLPLLLSSLLIGEQQIPTNEARGKKNLARTGSILISCGFPTDLAIRIVKSRVSLMPEAPSCIEWN